MMKNEIKPINAQKLRDRTIFKSSLDSMHSDIEELLRNDWLEEYPELSFLLQEMARLIENLDAGNGNE